MNVRVEIREKPYFQMDKTAPNDRRLSPTSLGVLTYLLSKPNNWRALKSDILAHFQGEEIAFTKNMLEAVFRELRKTGYAELVPIHGPGGTFKGSEYLIREVPKTEVATSSGVGESTDLSTSSDIGELPTTGESGVSFNNNDPFSKELLLLEKKINEGKEDLKNWFLMNAHLPLAICRAVGKEDLPREIFDFEVDKWLRHNARNAALLEHPSRFVQVGQNCLQNWVSNVKYKPSAGQINGQLAEQIGNYGENSGNW